MKVNFNGSIRDKHGGVSFVIRGLGLGLVVARKSYLFESMVLMIELHGAWTRIAYAWRILHADHLISEGDSAIVVTWI